MCFFKNFLDCNSLYSVLIIAIIVWLGIFLYIYRLHKRIKNLEKKFNNKE
ncbi:MAG: CcmD family protein [Ignavibacteria bacterium]|nr:CcmD family protein [Ignavibacteria bacterium]